MKIGVSDIDNFTFSQQLIDHWEGMGHEVSKSIYHEEKFVQECDVVFYDFASINVQELAKFGRKPRRCVVRAIDVENYFNYFDRFNFDLIDHFIFLNKSQYEMLKERGFDCPENKVHIIQMGIDLDKFTLKKNYRVKPQKIGFIGRLWIGKNVLGALDVAHLWWKRDKNIEFHILGDRFDPPWWKKMFHYRASQYDMPIYHTPYVEDVNEYLEDIDVLIQPSYKEAFSYVTAEAMAKGIPVLVHDWYGSHDVWQDWQLYKYPHEALEVYDKMVKDPKKLNPKKLREYIVLKYDQERMFDEIDALVLR